MFTGIARTWKKHQNFWFTFIRQQIDSDYEKYEQACKKRSEAASRAGKISAEKRALKKLQEHALFIIIHRAKLIKFVKV